MLIISYSSTINLYIILLIKIEKVSIGKLCCFCVIVLKNDKNHRQVSKKFKITYFDSNCFSSGICKL